MVKEIIKIRVECPCCKTYHSVTKIINGGSVSYTCEDFWKTPIIHCKNFINAFCNKKIK